MPYQIEQSEPGIVIVTWSGAMTRDEFIRALEARRQFATRQNMNVYALILDMSRVAMPLMDLRLVRWSTYVDHHLQRVFVVGAPPLVQAVARVLTQLSQIKVECVETLVEGKKQARASLQARAG
ncbi:MAG: hypothetical protein ABI690_00130 [Chloroflexota bacterium]